MSLENVRYAALPVISLIMITVGFGLMVMESQVLLGVVIILPFLAALWLVRAYQLFVTRRCVALYIQKKRSLRR